MKNILTIAILLVTSITANAQYTYSPNTYYLIPPTNGCNGVWAIKDTVACSLFIMDPCWQFDHINGDTMFLQLCYIPCSFYATANNGYPCVQAICEPISTSITEYYKTKELEIIWQDNNTFILKNAFEIFDKVSIISVTGQVILERTNKNEKEDITFNINNLPDGLYVIMAFKNGGIVNTKKIIKNYQSGVM